MKLSEKEQYMRMALSLALKARGKTHPNPMVGAVIVSKGGIISRGYHKGPGRLHAEAEAISLAKTSLKNAEMFVTLEPCCHFGRTPPCTDAIIASGIKKVYAAMKDPNPLNSGKGIKKLESAGISVETGILEHESLEMNKAYTKMIVSGLPYITIKLAQSLDGKISARDGSSKWISSEKSRKYVKELRAREDAIMVGINTVLKDDPTLFSNKKGSRKPVRVVLDSHLRIPERSALLRTAAEIPLIIGTTPRASRSKIEKLSKIKGVEIIVVRSRKEKVSLKPFLKQLSKRGITSIMSEGGGTLAGALIDEKLADEVIFFIAPSILGGDKISVRGKGAATISDIVELKDIKKTLSGRDIVLRGRIDYTPKTRDK